MTQNQKTAMRMRRRAARKANQAGRAVRKMAARAEREAAARDNSLPGEDAVEMAEETETVPMSVGVCDSEAGADVVAFLVGAARSAASKKAAATRKAKRAA